MDVIPLKVIFFDLGDTLVQKRPGAPDGERRKWVNGAQELLGRLKARGIRLGLISNTGDSERPELLNQLPADFSFNLFEAELVILSSEVDTQKPQRRIFAHAIDQAQVAPVESLFCTENIAHTLAAQEIGMRAVWVPLGNIEPFGEALLNAHVI